MKGPKGAVGYSCYFFEGESCNRRTSIFSFREALKNVNCLSPGSVGENSCYEYSACYSVGGSVFYVKDNSCRGQTSCSYAG